MACTIFPGLTFDSVGARANAQASTYYSCQYNDAVKHTADKNLEAAKYVANQQFNASIASTVATAVLAAAQTAVQAYFAQKQYETQKQAQDRLNLIATEQLRVSLNLRTQYELSMGCERQQLADACGDVAAPPDYESIKLRIRAPIIAQSTRRRLQATRSASVNCAAAACALNDRILVEEGRQIARAAESAFRREEALYEVRKARIRDFRSNVLQHMRGLSVMSSSSLAGAAATTQAAAGINPYAGWAAATNAAFGRAYGIVAQVGAAFSARAAAGVGAGGFGSMGGYAGGGGMALSDNGVANQTNSGMTFGSADYDRTSQSQYEGGGAFGDFDNSLMSPSSNDTSTSNLYNTVPAFDTDYRESAPQPPVKGSELSEDNMSGY